MGALLRKISGLQQEHMCSESWHFGVQQQCTLCYHCMTMHDQPLIAFWNGVKETVGSLDMKSVPATDML